MGLPETTPIGWWVGYKVEDADLWKGVKDGTYSMLSIGGRAKRRGPVIQKDGNTEFNNAIEHAEYQLEHDDPDDFEDNTWGYLDLITASVRTDVEDMGMRAYEFGGELLEEFAKPSRGSGLYPKGPISAPHGESIKCPNIYEALRRKGYSKRKAARISNRCAQATENCRCT
jgi:hypothetical protein